MYLIELKNITKTFSLNNKDKFMALNNVSVSFPSSGFIAVIGKSGCGKSTLLNIMAGLDKASSGSYLFNNRDMSNLSSKELSLFLNKRIGIIFQHYYLLEDKDVLFNVALPLLINGTSHKAAYKEAEKLLKELGFNEEFNKKIVKNLSGGEKQRVAIIRSIITSPNVIFADEPTGALDSKNSTTIMSILKKISKTKLVIIVSHNKDLVEKYCDRVIELKEGKLVRDISLNEIKEEGVPLTNTHMRNSKYWVEKISNSNLRKRFTRNIFSILSLSICLVATTLVLGFSKSAPKVINIEAKKRLDYGTISISKEEKSDIEGTFISLVQESRPTTSEINKLKKTDNEFIYLNNYESLLMNNLVIKYGENELDEVLLRPIYNYSSSYIDHSLLIGGNIPKDVDTFDEVIINRKCLELLKNTAKVNNNLDILHISSFYESSYYTFDESNTVINDIFVFDKSMKISAIVDELDFLSSPTIYYSYQGFVKYLSDISLNNLSTYFSKNITWKTRIDEAGDNDNLSGYSILGFLKNIEEKDKLSDYVSSINEGNLTATSLALTVEESLYQLVNASSKGMSIFLIIAILGVVLIIGILSFFSYTEDRKQSAILSSLGASRNSIISIYLFENYMVGLFSYFVALIFSFPFIKLSNYLINQFTSLNNMISFPEMIFTNFRYDYPLLLLIAMLLVVTLSTYIPIIFSKKISLSKELRDE